jgi:Leucine-rich repeat (LRR) protein
VFLSLLAVLCAVEAISEVECDFRVITSPNRYICDVIGANIDKIDQEVVFTGIHLPGRSNDDVNIVNISNSNIGFVIPQIFTTFPSLIRVDLTRIGLTEIPLRETFKIGRVEIFEIMFNERLTTIHSYAFPGASNLRELNLGRNAITNIHENAFYGLSRLQFLFLIGNRIQTLPMNLLKPLPILETLSLSENQISTLFTRQFVHSSRLIRIGLASNRLNAVERDFMEPMSSLSSMNLSNNQCIDFAFIFHIHRNASIVEALTPCYDNFDLL